MTGPGLGTQGVDNKRQRWHLRARGLQVQPFYSPVVSIPMSSKGVKLEVLCIVVTPGPLRATSLVPITSHMV